MANKLVIFPVEKETEAQAYLDWANNEYQSEEPGGIHGYIRNDVYGQWVVPYYGPPLEGPNGLIEEPENGPVMRVDGVLHDFAIWPVEED